MTPRSIEDRLREEYFALLPEIRLVAEQLETEIRHAILPLVLNAKPHERIRVVSRVKECQSAIDSLQRRQEANTFDRDIPDQYSLKNLRDLAGVRVLAFPRSLQSEIDGKLREKYPGWTSDPVPSADDGLPLAKKYYGHVSASANVGGEFQIVSMLIGLFWEVEHSALYKPTPSLKDVARSLEMRGRSNDVLNSLKAFEEEFEGLLNHGDRPASTT